MKKFLCQVLILLLLLFSGHGFSFQEEKESTHFIVGLNDQLHRSQTLIVHYTETPTLIRGVERVPSLSIYSDGYAQIFYPDYMRQAGHYEVYLNQGVMGQLYDLLIDENILKFDEVAIRSQMAAAQSQAEVLAPLSNASDVSKMTLDIFPGRFKLINTDYTYQKESVHITWSGLKQDISVHPEINALQGLIKIQQNLSAIMVHPDMQKVD